MSIGVNFCQAPGLSLHFLKSTAFYAFESPRFVRCKLITYYEAVFHCVTNNKMTLNDIHVTFIIIEQ